MLKTQKIHTYYVTNNKRRRLEEQNMEKASFMTKSIQLLNLLNVLKQNNILTADAINSIVLAYQNCNVVPVKNLIYSLEDKFYLIKKQLKELI